MSDNRIDTSAASQTQDEAAGQAGEKLSGAAAGLGATARSADDFDAGDQPEGAHYGSPRPEQEVGEEREEQVRRHGEGSPAVES